MTTPLTVASNTALLKLKKNIPNDPSQRNSNFTNKII